MAKKTDNPDQHDTPESRLLDDAERSWNALAQIRSTWEDKERALLAQVNDSFSGNVTRARVTDAALSTLAFERQARVAAQLPTGKVYPASKKDEGKANLQNIVLQRYILPNSGRDFSMLTLQRLWGLYASVYGSMPMFYDYCVEDDYIGPYASLVDPRSFMPQPGFNSINTADWCMISTTMSVSELQKIADRKATSWDKKKVKELLAKHKIKDAKPSKDDDSEKDSFASRSRYSKAEAKGRIELITKYERGEDGHWITFAPDYDGIILRDIPNPHKSGRIPVVMRHCFPLLNSIFGLGDFERGMRLQKAKDSLLGLRLERAKNETFPPLLQDDSKVTPSTIKWGAGLKWKVTDVNNGVKPLQFGPDSQNNWQGTWSSLEGMLQNQFGSTTTQLNSEQSSNPAFGRTPQALKMQQQRENARDTWDRFMHEQAVEELYEGLLNLQSVKMEKPINFTVFEEEIRQLGEDHENVLEMFDSGKTGVLTLSKKDLASKNGFTYLIDANSSMRQDDEEQFNALFQLFEVMGAVDPQVLQMSGVMYDRAEHLKKLFISAGITDWERILQESDPEAQQAMQPVIPDMSHLEPELQEFAGQLLGVQQQPQQPQMGAM